jgi:hypothetical protein
MRFNEYYITNKDGKSNCVIRSFCKLFNEDYEDVYNGLCDIANEINCDSFNDVEVFENYMKRHNTFPIEYGKDIKIKNLNLDNGSYIIFCWDKNDFYHMVSVIDDVLYDRTNESLELDTIKIYKKDR